MLSTEQIQQFLTDGVLVVDNVLSKTEVENAITGLHKSLACHGVSPSVDDENSGRALQHLSSTNGSGGVLDIFYEDWKMDIATNEKLFAMTQDLWRSAYSPGGQANEHSLWWHPYGPFDSNHGFLYIDRVCYRLPTTVSDDIGNKVNKDKKKKARAIQRSLTPHLDCCPDKLFENTAKWRPIQCFVSLTDNLEKNTGGFEAAKGFHTNFREWAKNRPPTKVVQKQKDGSSIETAIPAACVGEYTHIRPKEDKDVMERVSHIPVKAGSAVFWDNHIPHANAYRHFGTTPRAVVYCSFLPDVELNRMYARNQLKKFELSLPIRDQWNQIDHVDDHVEKKNIQNYAFTALGRKLMGIEPWTVEESPGSL